MLCRCLGEKHHRQIRDKSNGFGRGLSLAGPCGRNGEQGGNQAGVGRLSWGRAGETTGGPQRHLSI